MGEAEPRPLRPSRSVFVRLGGAKPRPVWGLGGAEPPPAPPWAGEVPSPSHTLLSKMQSGHNAHRHNAENIHTDNNRHN